MYRDGLHNIAFDRSERNRAIKRQMDSLSSQIAWAARKLGIEVAVTAATMASVAGAIRGLVGTYRSAQEVLAKIEAWFALENKQEDNVREIKAALDDMSKQDRIIEDLSARMKALGCPGA